MLCIFRIESIQIRSLSQAEREQGEQDKERKEREIDFVNKVEGIEEEIVSWVGHVNEY